MRESPPDSATPSHSDSTAAPSALALAKRLSSKAQPVELQGTVLHRSPSHVMAVAFGCSAVLVLLGQIAPLLCSALLVLVMVSLIHDTRGGQGWVRRLLALRDAGLNILFIRSPRLPVPTDPHRFKKHPPGPPLKPISTGAQLLLCLPADDADLHHTASQKMRLFMGLGLTVIGIISLLVTPLRMWGLCGYTAMALAGVSALCKLHHILNPPPLAPSPALGALDPLLAALNGTPAANMTVSVALIEGLFAYGDGLGVLLQNYASIFPAAHTKVLVLLPDNTPLHSQSTSGFLGRMPADAGLVNATGLPTKAGHCAAVARACSLGWAAAAVSGNLQETHAICDVLAHIDDMAGEQPW